MNGPKALLILLAVIAPGLLGGLWLRKETLDYAELEHATRLESASAAARDSVDAAQRRARAAVARLCEGDVLVDRLLFDLETARFGPTEQSALVEHLPPLMRSMDLAALSLIDGRPGARYGRVLGAGHFAGRAGADEALLARAVERAGERWFVHVLRVRRGGETHEVSALLTGCVRQHGGARVVVVGGKPLDAAFIEALAVPGTARGEGPRGDGERGATVEVLLGEEGGAAPRPSFAVPSETREVHVFTDLERRPVATLYAVIDAGPLETRRAELDRALAIGLVVSVFVALVVVGFLWRDLAKTFREIQRVAAQVGRGDMSTQARVGSGGAASATAQSMNEMVRKIRERDEQIAEQQRNIVRAERIAERIAAWRTIAQRIAHEVKNPLTPMKTAVENMRKSHARRLPDFDETFDESTVAILQEVERLRRLVTDFSDFARIPPPQPTDLTVEDVARHVVSLYAGGEVAVTLVTERGVGPVRADRGQLTQVILNLVKNASEAARARHGARGGRVEVHLAPDGDGAVVRVTDNGPGVPHDQREKIFEPYFTTKKESDGTGLGLAVVHRIVTDHGGSLEVTDAEGGGAVFELRLTRQGPPRDASTTATDATAMPLVQRR